MKVLERGGLRQRYKYAYKWFQLDLLENRMENNFCFCVAVHLFAQRMKTPIWAGTAVFLLSLFKIQQHKKKNQENHECACVLVLAT